MADAGQQRQIQGDRRRLLNGRGIPPRAAANGAPSKSSAS